MASRPAPLTETETNGPPQCELGAERRPAERNRATHPRPLLIGPAGPALPSLASSLTRSSPGDTEPHVIKPRLWHASPPHGSPDAPMLVRPSAAAQHTIVGVPGRIGVVPAPLPHVSQHVKQTESVGLFPPNSLRPRNRIGLRPRNVGQRAVVRAGRSRSAGPFPLRLRRQPKPLGSHLPQHPGIANLISRSEARLTRQRVAPVHSTQPRHRMRGHVRILVCRQAPTQHARKQAPGHRGGRQLELPQLHGAGGLRPCVPQRDRTGGHSDQLRAEERHISD